MYDGGAAYQFSFKRSIAPGNGLMGDIDCRRLRNLPSVKVAVNERLSRKTKKVHSFVISKAQINILIATTGRNKTHNN